MSNHPNRDAVELCGPYLVAPMWRPDEPGRAVYCNMRWTNARRDLEATAWEPLALYRFGGTLVRHRQTGRLAEHRSHRLVSVNERKAEAALLALQADHAAAD